MDPVLCNCDVLAFVSQPNDEHALHTAVLQLGSLRNPDYLLPPNTLLTLESVQEPGEWEAPKDTPAFGSSMGGGPSVYPQQRLFVVTATYQEPRADSTGRIAQQLASLAEQILSPRRYQTQRAAQAVPELLERRQRRPAHAAVERYDPIRSLRAEAPPAHRAACGGPT